jgi:hypothetical protein
MRTETRTVYVARDGRDFPTRTQCLAHERETCGAALVGLTEAQIEAARTGADPELADAFEMFGYELRKARQGAGQFKRRRRPNGEPADNVGDKSGPPLSDDAGGGRADDSLERTDGERAIGAG